MISGAAGASDGGRPLVAPSSFSGSARSTVDLPARGSQVVVGSLDGTRCIGAPRGPGGPDPFGLEFDVDGTAGVAVHGWGSAVRKGADIGGSYT